LLTESGIAIAQGSAPLWRAVAELQDNESGPTPILREILVEMSERLRLVEERLKGYDSLITVLRVTTSKRSASLAGYKRNSWRPPRQIGK
jgi:hypothetical protein